MQLTQRAKQVDRRPMTWLEKIYLWNIMKGMWITLSHFFKRKATANTVLFGPSETPGAQAVEQFVSLSFLLEDAAEPKRLA